MSEHQKQMLYLSVHGQDQEPYIRFEIEPYYAKRSRMIKTEQHIEVFDKHILLRDKDFKEKLGFSAILSLLIHYEVRDYKHRNWAYIVYPHHRGKQAVLRIDAEPYEYKSERMFCSDLLLESLNVNRKLNNGFYKQTLAEKILTHLPISEEVCMQE